MIIYEFCTWGAYKGDNGLFSISEIEVEEKPKSYVGKHTRILKEDIDKLHIGCGNKMYRLSNDPKPYIKAMIEAKKDRIKSFENSIKVEKAELGKWELL
jgi:hypothetical protein